MTERLPLPDPSMLPGKNATRALVLDAAQRVDEIDAEHLSIGDRLALNIAYGVLRQVARTHGKST